ncbi:hypothetical protein ABT369_56255 [Dactylosporangium sp. NPDC000244]|uniref:hypothetical protein n=1 Tax=Dactylosporangium sp. NPDC000244 TaxID=3154365 RepID=UPI003319700F
MTVLTRPVHAAAALRTSAVDEVEQEPTALTQQRHQEGDGDTEERWGRRLNTRTVSTLGLTEFLQSPTGVPDRLAADLAGYLAGPAVPITEFAVIDADLRFRGEHGIAGWTLARLPAADLDAITPLPSIRPFGSDPWDEALRVGDCCVLRRIADHLTAQTASFFPREVMTSLFEPELVISAWEPMLLLNLAQPERAPVRRCPGHRRTQEAALPAAARRRQPGGMSARMSMSPGAATASTRASSIPRLSRTVPGVTSTRGRPAMCGGRSGRWSLADPVWARAPMASRSTGGDRVEPCRAADRRSTSAARAC